jgi:hypothetical protein
MPKSVLKKLLVVANLKNIDLRSLVRFFKKYARCSKLPSRRLISNDHQFYITKSTIAPYRVISNTSGVLKKCLLSLSII